MLILIMLIVVTVLFVVFAYVADDRGHDAVCFILIIASIAAFVFTLVFGTDAIASRISIEADTLALEQTYKDLNYQVENGMYDNENEVGKKQLADQVMEWNSDLAKNKALHHSVWVSAMYPIDYDKFDFIPIEKLNTKSK